MDANKTKLSWKPFRWVASYVRKLSQSRLVEESLSGDGVLKQEIRRQLTVLHLRPARCVDCVHFDLETGQRMIREDERFRLLMHVLSPDEMAAAGKSPEQKTKTSVANRERLGKGVTHTWLDYGYCTFHEQHTHKVGDCPDWE